MVDTITTKVVPVAAAHTSRQGYQRGVLRRLLRGPGGVVVGIVTPLLLALALFGPWLIVENPYQTSMFPRPKPTDSNGFPLGSDELKCDMPSRLILDTRLSLFVGIVSVVFAFFIGGAIGIIAGYTGGKTNTMIMHTVNVSCAFLSVLLAIALSGALGTGIGNALLSLTLVFVPQVVRIAGNVTAQVRHMGYIDAARATGASALVTIYIQVLDNALGPIFVFSTGLVSVCMILTSGPSFLGLGVRPPEPEWGLMLNTLRTAVYTRPRVAALPGLMTFITSISFNILADRLHAVMTTKEQTIQPFINIDLGGPAQPLLKVNHLLRYFRGNKGREVVQTVDGINFTMMKSETLGVIGESGCGKSTVARLLMQLLAQDSGELIFDGQGVDSSCLPLKTYRRQVQMVFQDSYASLNPRMTMEESIAFGQRVHGVSIREASEYAHYLLAHVGLKPTRFADRYPHALSGGQRQQVNIARALAMKPRLVILDEAMSILDKSVETQVLQLLQELRQILELTYVFVSHDLHVVRWLSDRILAIYLGEVVEIDPAEQLFTTSTHPYIRALLSSMSSMGPENRALTSPLNDGPPGPIMPPSDCRFHTRYPHAKVVCAEVKLRLEVVGEGHQSAHLMAQPALP